VIIFGSVRFLSKKSNQTEKNKKKKPKLVQTDRFRFGSVWFFRTKTGSNRFGSVFWFGSVLARFFLVWLGFFDLPRFFRFGSGLAQFFPVWLSFLSGFFPVRCGFFGFRLIKLKPNRTSRFF
jgi:hypothetical protein